MGGVVSRWVERCITAFGIYIIAFGTLLYCNLSGQKNKMIGTIHRIHILIRKFLAEQTLAQLSPSFSEFYNEGKS